MKMASLSSVNSSATVRDEFRKIYHCVLFTALALAALLAIPVHVSADVILLEANIDGVQANAGAGSGSAGTGVATMTFDDATNLFSWTIVWDGLLAPAFAAHFHGPALPNQNAGVQVPIIAVSPSIGAAFLDNLQAANLLAGLWYINIHTPFSPGGEIRGQVRVAELQIEVAIDIKFCSDPNAFNCKKKGVLPVTIFGTESFDVADIDVSTLQLCQADLSACTNGPKDWSMDDRGDPVSDLGAAMCAIDPATGLELDTLNPDGFLDLDAAFEASEVQTILEVFCGGLKNGVSPALVIIGSTFDGTPIISVPFPNTGIDQLVKKNK
jgi:hypothetical protein